MSANWIDVEEGDGSEPTWTAWEPTAEQKKVGAERLMRLHDLLVADAANPEGVRFDLGVWAVPFVENEEEDEADPNWVPRVSCGTAACAVGLACVSGEFAKDGLVGQMGYDSIYPAFDDYRHWPAVKLFFGLNDDEATFLFTEHVYECDDLPTKGSEAELVVADRIKNFVTEKRNV